MMSNILQHLYSLSAILKAARRVAAAPNDVERRIAARLLGAAIDSFDEHGFGTEEAELRLSLAVMRGKEAA